MLEAMVSVRAGGDLFSLAERLHEEGSDGILLSGGSNRAGTVPLVAHLRHVPKIREELGMKVVVHSGLVTPELAQALGLAGVDGVMIDLIGADETLRDVYHLDRNVKDVERSLRLLCEQGLCVIPHIVLGLHFGRFLGEWRALEMVTDREISTLVLVVLVPLAGTPMAGVVGPSVTQLAEFFARARLTAPSMTINLGCARPLGREKLELDQAAIDLGLNGIAYPADGAIDYARSRGLTPRLFEYCCSLTWNGADQVGLATVKVSS
jgi:uncharacterized radical SAM superfamily protein